MENDVPQIGTLRAYVKTELKRMDEQLDEQDSHWVPAAVLLASMIVGADEDHIAFELGIVEADMDDIATRLRSAGIWNNAMVPELDAYISDGVAFWMDAAVAEGLLTKSGVGEHARYQQTDSAKQLVEKMRKRAECPNLIV